MRRILAVAFLAVVATGVWWLAEDGELRRHVVAVGEKVLDRASGGAPPSWGDVAAKVGEFGAEERGLKEVVGGGKVAPDPAPPE